jgi:hypothetical protein
MPFRVCKKGTEYWFMEAIAESILLLGNVIANTLQALVHLEQSCQVEPPVALGALLPLLTTSG